MSTDERPPGSGGGERDSWDAERPTALRSTQPLPGPPREIPLALPPARPAAEPYRLGIVLGEGGMAVIYDAHDPTLGRSVAVKVMKPELAGDPDLQSRFLHEARILGQLEHPGVVPVFSAGSLPGVGPFYAMKKVRGRTLREILRGMSQRDFGDRRHTARFVDIFEKVCQTVAYAHSAGILHRDLKPENIMVDEFGVVVVLDWGLSKKLTASAEEQGIVATQVGMVKGTPAYMSPEQASGSTAEVNFRTDVFALGIILYEILTGALPFSGHSRTEVMEKVIYHDPAPPRKLNRQASRTLAAVCMKALSKDPAKRYESAQGLAADIRLYRDRLPTSAYRPGPLERVGNWVGRHPALAAAAGTALLLALAFGGYLWHRHDAQRIRADEQRQLEALAELRDKDKLQKSLLTIRDAYDALRRLDEDSAALEAKRQNTPASDAARLLQLQHDFEQVEAARYILSNRTRIRAVGAITEFRTKRGLDFGQLDPEVMKFFRERSLQTVRDHMKRREWYIAHYYLWDYLRPDRDSAIQWTDAERAEFTALMRQVEEKLREKIGPDLPLPDWRRFHSLMPRRPRD